ncbi:MAG: flavodoxin family protein [Oscillospiraceae bacterium]|jgi:multimeric flavodoxin WrbA|nr:flavodoxin family protein [Oscillospiraceae bacterium]
MYIIITASPNKDGLTAACGQAMKTGIEAAHGQVELIDISEEKLSPCLICGNGWGSCISSAKCVVSDALSDLQAKIRRADGVALVTPVYFGQPSERMKYFLDRFRRCEAFNQQGSAAKGKPIDLIAAAGGSGNGTAPALVEMETWCRHVGAIPGERIGVTRFNRETMLKAIEAAGARLAARASKP